jgi:Fur family transcriptional regulator, ferric uptake regulator
VARPSLDLPPHARLTPQRRVVLGLIAGWRGAFTVVELYDRARRTEPKLGLATVYRTVDLLRRTGSVRPLGGDEPTYVRCRPGHHHHLVCLTCGGVEETDLCAAPSPAELKRLHGFAPNHHELDIYGTCARCAAA